MNRNISTAIAILILGLMLGIFNQAGAVDLPETPITKILNHKTSLDLSEAQVKKLNLVNNNIINQMLQLEAQAQNHRAEIGKAAANWSELGNTRIKGIVKEYYRCQGEIKNLELEAMVQASRILTSDQIGKFNNLASLELIMLDGADNMTITN